MSSSQTTPAPRITSIDALRGLVIFAMIFVNDLDHVVPAWMKHYHGKSGMTFVDMVFPAFLFIVGMSIPFALGSRLEKDESLWKTMQHVVERTLALLVIGIMMVNNETPAPETADWHPTLWAVMFFISAILAFCSLSQVRTRFFSIAALLLRAIGMISLLFLAFAFQGEKGKHIITLSPFSINTEWYGILGLIGAAYFVGAIVFLIFRNNRTALLGCVVLLMSLYAADKTGAFENFALSRYVGIGDMLGSQAAITVAGVLLAAILTKSGLTGNGPRVRFALFFILAFSAAAWLTTGLYGINKNDATPAWCLWACAFTGALWLGFYLLADAWPDTALSKLAKPFYIAGQNVLLAYLFSELFPSMREWLNLDDWYSSLGHADVAHAVMRSIGCAVFILAITNCLNRVGFRVRL